jgi:hypothetical protein
VLTSHPNAALWQQVPRAYLDETDRILWLDATFGAATVREIWQQPTTRRRVAVANRYLTAWLRGVLVQNGMPMEDEERLISALDDRLWELLQRGYHVLVQRMTPESANAFLRGTFGLGS